MDTLTALREAAAAAPDDARRLYLIQNGAVFALLSIRQNVRYHEECFARWLAAGRPSDLEGICATLPTMRNRTLRAIMALTTDDAAEIVRLIGRNDLGAERYLASRVPGLGQPKASFALACSGFGRTACFDSHLLSRYSADVAAAGFNPKAGSKSAKAWDAYRDLCAAVYGRRDSAKQQWAEWLRDHGRGLVHTGLLEGLGR